MTFKQKLITSIVLTILGSYSIYRIYKKINATKTPVDTTPKMRVRYVSQQDEKGSGPLRLDVGQTKVNPPIVSSTQVIPTLVIGQTPPTITPRINNISAKEVESKEAKAVKEFKEEKTRQDTTKNSSNSQLDTSTVYLEQDASSLDESIDNHEELRVGMIASLTEVEGDFDSFDQGVDYDCDEQTQLALALQAEEKSKPTSTHVGKPNQQSRPIITKDDNSNGLSLT